MVSPAQRKAGVGHVVKKQLCTERQACRYLKVSRSIVYRSKQVREESEENQLILKISQEKVTWGILKVTSYIRNKYGKTYNHKRVARIRKNMDSRRINGKHERSASKEQKTPSKQPQK